MKKQLLSILLVILGTYGGSLDAGSVILVNDSPYKLRAVVRGSDGTFLGETVVAPQNTNSWNDGYAGLPAGQDITRSQTPYTVLWYCLEGDTYSINTPVPTGTQVTAQSGQGARQCHPQKQKQPEGEQQQPAPLIPLPSQQQPNTLQEPQGSVQQQPTYDQGYQEGFNEGFRQGQLQQKQQNP